MRLAPSWGCREAVVGTELAFLIAGAGTMGHGIAVCFADRGWRVTLVDPSANALRLGRLFVVITAVSGGRIVILVSKTQREPMVKPDGVSDDFRGKSDALDKVIPSVNRA